MEFCESIINSALYHFAKKALWYIPSGRFGSVSGGNCSGFCSRPSRTSANSPRNRLAAEMLTRDRVEEKAKVIRMMNMATQTVTSEVERARGANREKVLNVSRGLLSKYIEPALMRNRQAVERVGQSLLSRYIEPMREKNMEKMERCYVKMRDECERTLMAVRHKQELLETLNPEKVLKQGYAIVAGKISPGSVVKITTMTQEVEAEVKKVEGRKITNNK